MVNLRQIMEPIRILIVKVLESRPFLSNPNFECETFWWKIFTWKSNSFQSLNVYRQYTVWTSDSEVPWVQAVWGTRQFEIFTSQNLKKFEVLGHRRSVKDWKSSLKFSSLELSSWKSSSLELLELPADSRPYLPKRRVSNIELIVCFNN